MPSMFCFATFTRYIFQAWLSELSAGMVSTTGAAVLEVSSSFLPHDATSVAASVRMINLRRFGLRRFAMSMPWVCVDVT
jgi:hypothetical protein